MWACSKSRCCSKALPAINSIIASNILACEHSCVPVSFQDRRLTYQVVQSAFGTTVDARLLSSVKKDMHGGEATSKDVIIVVEVAILD